MISSCSCRTRECDSAHGLVKLDVKRAVCRGIHRFKPWRKLEGKDLFAAIAGYAGRDVFVATATRIYSEDHDGKVHVCANRVLTTDQLVD